MSGHWTVEDLFEAIGRLPGVGPDSDVTFIDLDGVELPFRWMYGPFDGGTGSGVTIRLDVDGGTVHS